MIDQSAGLGGVGDGAGDVIAHGEGDRAAGDGDRVAAGSRRPSRRRCSRRVRRLGQVVVADIDRGVGDRRVAGDAGDRRLGRRR